MGPAVRFERSTRSLAPCRRSLLPLGDLPYPPWRKRCLFRLAIVSFAIGRCCSDPTNQSVSPSARDPQPPNPPYSPLKAPPPPPPPASPRGAEAEFPIQVSYVSLPGRGHWCSHARTRPFPHPRPHPAPRPLAGAGTRTHEQGRAVSTVSRIRSPVASELGQSHVDPLELGPRRTLEGAHPPPGGPRHPPNEADTRPLGALLLFSFCHPSSQRAWVTASREAGQGLPCPCAETNAWFVWGVAAIVPSVRD